MDLELKAYKDNPSSEPLLSPDSLHPAVPTIDMDLPTKKGDKVSTVSTLRVLHLSGMTSGTTPFLTNRLNNQKYTLLNFVPHVLYEQFRFFFNLFFLLLCLTQFIPILKVGLLFSYLAPLIFVIALSMLKEAFDGFWQYNSPYWARWFLKKWRRNTCP